MFRMKERIDNELVRKYLMYNNMILLIWKVGEMRRISGLEREKNKPIVKMIFILFITLSSISCTNTLNNENWIPLFNGVNLNNWTVKINGYPAGVNYKDLFRVENGLLKVSYDQCETFDDLFGHIFYNQKFSNYKLRVVYRFVGDQVSGAPKWAFRNSGVMLHSQSPESMAINQRFPVCFEAQLLGGEGTGERTTANLATIGTKALHNGEIPPKMLVPSNSNTFHGDQWVKLEVEVYGDSLVRHRVNSEEVLTYMELQYDETDQYAIKLLEKAGKKINSGYIAIQAESHPVEFRKIEILQLSK